MGLVQPLWVWYLCGLEDVPVPMCFGGSCGLIFARSEAVSFIPRSSSGMAVGTGLRGTHRNATKREVGKCGKGSAENKHQKI